MAPTLPITQSDIRQDSRFFLRFPMVSLPTRPLCAPTQTRWIVRSQYACTAARSDQLSELDPKTSVRIMSLLAPCADGSAVATMLVHHNATMHMTHGSHGPKITGSTFLSRTSTRTERSMKERIRRQLQLALVLLRSLRRSEARCRRPFLLLLGTGVRLSSSACVALEKHGVRLVPVPPKLPGVPSADKLYAWTLTEFRRILVVGADVMFLRPIDDLFETTTAPFVMAHHSTDLIQGSCGVACERRGVGGFLVIRPEAGLYDQLVRALRGYKPYHLEHSSEQTMLACFFRNVSHTLPCTYLYDLASPALGACKLALRRPTSVRSSVCLGQFAANCVK